MACAIHHGGGVGTYKTFSVIQRHAIPQLKAGRIVVSTVRGFDSIRVIEAVLDIDIPDSSEIIFIDLETSGGIEKIRRWWEWVPLGAYVIIDEAQLIYPKSKKISLYDYSARDGLSSEEAAEKDGRPNGFLQAFTMQRHYNWDLAIITPNIKMLVPEIREVSQIAYEHRYLGGLLPWRKHGWREIQHLPLEAAKTSVHAPKQFNADKRIYQCYRSTRTGSHSDSGAEQSIFRNPRVVGSLSLAFLGIVCFIYILFTQIFSSDGTLGKSQGSRKNGVSPVQVFDSSGVSDVSAGNVITAHSSGKSFIDSGSVKYVETTALESETMSIVGKLWNEYVIEIGRPPNSVQVTTGTLFKNGIGIEIVSDCHINMLYRSVNHVIRCPLHPRFSGHKDNAVSVDVTPFKSFMNSGADASKRAMASGATSGGT